MKLYNTLTRTIEEFSPLSKNEVSMYSCGPTLYGRAQIGNLVSFIYADMLRRVLTAAGYKVNHVMNFTDVDDKTIKQAKRQYPKLEPNEAIKKLTNKLEKEFLSDLESVGIDTEAITFVRATDSIPQMQKLISKLVKQNIAYLADDGIYFSIEAYKKAGKKYGQLSKITKSSTSKQRIINDEYDKESARDFALWKFKKAGEPNWDFKLDGENYPGRPGWHIECSAMSTDNLGQPFDIHTGGIDLIFPHHENEIAQSTATTKNNSYAELFFHNEHLLVDGKKMSKSLGNFFTLKDITDKGFDPLAFRLLSLQSHYRKPVNFTWESLEAASNLLNKLRNWAVLRHQTTDSPNNNELALLNVETGKSVAISLGQDLNVPASLAFINHLVESSQDSAIDAKILEDAVVSIDNLYGLDLYKQPDINQEAKDLLKDRANHRGKKDWTQADKVRDQLQELGVEVRDTPTGQKWARILS